MYCILMFKYIDHKIKKYVSNFILYIFSIAN